LLWSQLATFPAVPGAQIAQDRTEQWAASLCAAVEALLELAEPAWDISLVPDPHAIRVWAERLAASQLSRELVVFVHTLARRALALHQQWNDALLVQGLSETESPSSETAHMLQRWSDWWAPELLHDRVRLEVLRTWPPGISPPREILDAWQNEAIGRLWLIDAERLVSRILSHRLAHGLIPAEELEMLVQADATHYNSDRQPNCAAHHDVEPLFVMLALCWSALENTEQAMAVLDARRAQAERTGYDVASILAAEQTKSTINQQIGLNDHHGFPEGNIERASQ
jgi:hypothetical protein